MGRGPGYSPQELNSLLDIIEKRLPVDASEWVEVAYEHRLTWKFEKRGMESIKRKFTTLYRGKTSVHDTIFTKRAIKILHAIQEKKGNSYGDTEHSVPKVIHIQPTSVQTSDGCEFSSDEDDSSQGSSDDSLEELLLLDELGGGMEDLFLINWIKSRSDTTKCEEELLHLQKSLSE